MSRCPSVQQLEELLEQQLGGAEDEALSLHVGTCDHCQRTLEQLTEDPLAAVCRPVRVAEPVEAPSAASDSQAAFLSRLKQSLPSWDGRPLPAEVPPEPPAVAGYEILGVLGRGGMGVVYKARQQGLDRLVALKMILAGTHAGPHDLARFRREAEAVARLRHPNIVQVYDIGEANGNPYITLEYLDGGSLAQLTRGDPQPLPAAVRLVETLARAVHFAHEQGIIHRDLKPSNILLQGGERDKGEGTREKGEGERAEAPAPGSSAPFGLSLSPSPFPLLPFASPKIADFGLAKRLDEPSSRTQSGEVLGTPSYMAPEQAGKAAAVGRATDVYALGAILYELLTGRPPFKGATPLDTVLLLLHEELVRPRSLRPDLPRDLETICLKCLAKDAGKRYASAQALADDLHHFRRGRPIQARPVPRYERAWKWARHRPLAAGLLAGMLLVGLLGFAGVTWQWQEAKAARDTALAEKQEKEQQRLDAEQARTAAENARRQEADQRSRALASLYVSRIAQGQLQWQLNDQAAARQSLAKCRPPEGQEDWRGWEWYFLRGLFRTELFNWTHTAGGPSGCATFGGQGSWVASVIGAEPEGETVRPGEVRVWDARSGAQLHAGDGPGTLHRVAARPDGRLLALGTTDGVILFRDARSGRELRRRAAHQDAVAGLTFSPDGHRLASAGWDQAVRLWDGDTGDLLFELRGHAGRVQGVAFHPGGRYLATGSWDTTVKIWDTRDRKEVRTLEGHKSPVHCVVYSPDGRHLASAASNGNLKVWEVESGRTVQSLTGRSGAVLSAAFSPDGRYLAYGGSDSTVRIWDVESGVERATYRGHQGPVESLDFSPDGQRLVSCSAALGEVKVWDLTRHPQYATFARTERDVEAIAFSADRERLLSVSRGGNLQSWDAATGVLLDERRLPLPGDVASPAVPADFAPDGRRLAALCREDVRAVKVWDTATGAGALTLAGHTLPVHCVRFSSDGKLLATGGCDPRRERAPHEVRVWDAATGEPLLSVSGHGFIFTLAFSPDARWLAWGGPEGQLTLLDRETGQPVVEKSSHVGDVTAIAFSPDGRLLTTAGFEDRMVKLWKWGPRRGQADPFWRPVQTLPAPRLLGDLAFSPDGRRLAAVSRDLVKIWSVEMGQEVLTLRGAPKRYWDPAFNPRVRFSPDGRLLAGTNWDESISLWEAEYRTDGSRSRRRRAADERAHFWHLQEAEHCLQHQNPTAARFHLQRLQDVALPAPLHARKERLLERVGNANP